MPIRLYGSEVTGFENLQPLGKIHLDYEKHIENEKQHSTGHGLWGVWPLSIRNTSKS